MSEVPSWRWKQTLPFERFNEVLKMGGSSRERKRALFSRQVEGNAKCKLGLSREREEGPGRDLPPFLPLLEGEGGGEGESVRVVLQEKKALIEGNHFSPLPTRSIKVCAERDTPEVPAREGSSISIP